MRTCNIRVELRRSKHLQFKEYVRLWFDDKIHPYPFFSLAAANEVLCSFVHARLNEVAAADSKSFDFREIGHVQGELFRFVEKDGLPLEINGFDHWAQASVIAGVSIPLGEEDPPPQEAATTPVQAEHQEEREVEHTGNEGSEPGHTQE